MKGDAVLFHPLDEHVGSEARQRREGKARIGAQKALARQRRGGVDIGEIAAAAAGNADFLARIARVVDHEDAAPAPPGLDAGQHARGPGSQHDDVEIGHVHPFSGRGAAFRPLFSERWARRKVKAPGGGGATALTLSYMRV